MSTGIALVHDWFPRALPLNVSIGEASWVYSAYAFIHCRSRQPVAVRIGAHSGVYHGSFFELGPSGEVQIGDYCTLVGAIINTNGRVEIHDYAFLAHEVVLADSFASVPSSTPFAVENEDCDRRRHGAERIQQPIGGEASIVVGKNAWIGVRAILLRGARIGANSVVGASAVVDFDVPNDTIVAGNPARLVGTVARTRDRQQDL